MEVEVKGLYDVEETLKKTMEYADKLYSEVNTLRQEVQQLKLSLRMNQPPAGTDG